MAYEKTVWTKGEVVTAEKLNKIEAGIYSTHQLLDGTVTSTGELNADSENNTALASVGFVETRLQQLRTALDQSDSRKVLTGLTLTNERGFVGTYTSIPLAATNATGLMQVGANLDVTDGVVKVSDGINSTGADNHPLVLNENITIGKKITNNDTTTYGNVTVAGLLVASGGITSPTGSALTIGSATTNQNVTSRSALTVEATATFNGSSTFNDITVNGTVNGTLNAPNVIAENINSNTGNNLVLNENVTIGKKITENDNTSYGNITIKGLLAATGGISTSRIISSSITSFTNTELTIGTVTVNQGVTSRSTLTVDADATFNGTSTFNASTSIKGAFEVGTVETNNTTSNFYGPVYITGNLTGTDLSITNISATKIQINKPVNSGISYNDYTTAINGTVRITDDVTIDGQLKCNSSVVIQADSQGINWVAERQTGLTYRSLIRANDAIYSLLAQYEESNEPVYNTILEYKPNITSLTLSGILSIGTAISTTGNIDTTDDTMVSKINIAAANEICLKTIGANTSIVLDSNTEINGNTKINGTLEIINDTNDPVLSIGRTSGSGIGFTYTSLANFGLLPLLPLADGDYVLHVDSTAAPGSQYTWVPQTT